MTDYLQDSARPPLNPPPFSAWSSGPVTQEASLPPRSSAAALASSLNELLAGIAARRIPHLEALRYRLQEVHAGTELAQLQHCLKMVQDSASAVDVLSARAGGEEADQFMQQVAALAENTHQLTFVGGSFLQRNQPVSSVARAVCMGLKLETEALMERVQQGMRWLHDMEQDVMERRDSATAEVSQEALRELARRGSVLQERLRQVDRLCGHARSALELAEQFYAQRAALCDMLQRRVRPRSRRLHEVLRPLLQADARTPQSAELMAVVESRHELQVVLTEAGADMAALRAFDRELVAHLDEMEQALQPAA
ncbi:hypothetical protein WG902_11780 [Ramlibacter sp. PS3R-8]|uniref:hypothetical protein n=1 Tax=Ramlibacter sp. PS3R-8 TaxID=3133437 RepID=UPI00309DDE51